MSALTTILRTGAELGTYALGLALAIACGGAVGAVLLGAFSGALWAELFAPVVVSHVTDWFWRQGSA